MQSEILFGFAERQIIKIQIIIWVELSLTSFIWRREDWHNLPSNIESDSVDYYQFMLARWRGKLWYKEIIHE